MTKKIYVNINRFVVKYNNKIGNTKQVFCLLCSIKLLNTKGS